MINVLEFSNLFEYKHAWNMSARACYYIFENLDRCQILYKYKLSDGFIYSKFGVSDATKINFEKINGDSIFIFHLDIFEKSVDELPKLLDFCLEKNIDVYIPMVVENAPVREGRKYTHIEKIREILEGYETNRYDFTNMSYNNKNEIESAIIEKSKPLIRDIKLRGLL